MIPTIETIVNDLLAGKITKQQAIEWLNQHAESAGRELRDDFAAAALAQAFMYSDRHHIEEFAIEDAARVAYALADAMCVARTPAVREPKNG